jgi:hypothetical protein
LLLLANLLNRKRPGKAIFQGNYFDGMIASQPMKEAINEANHLDSGSAKAGVLGKSPSRMAGERTVSGGLLSQTRPEEQELCILEEKAGAGKGCGLPGGGSESASGTRYISLQATSSHAWESIWD